MTFSKSMKQVLLISFACVATASLLLAQGRAGSNSNRRFQSPYDLHTPPPVGLSEAYALAVAQMNVDTNRCYCVSASCQELTRRGLPGWTFYFANTNGQRADVEVSFDKEVAADDSKRDFLRGK
jgi:hypothetical protein